MSTQLVSERIYWRKDFITKFVHLVMVCVLALSISLSTFLYSPPKAKAAPELPLECVTGSLPSLDPKYPADQLILICVPPTWNGMLVVYAHGYVAPQAPLALPLGELTLPDGTFVPQELLLQGFAFATTSYSRNGYAVEQAGKDLNALVAHFNQVAGLVAGHPAARVLIVGASEGGLITTMLVERFPSTYHGGLALCGPVGGMPFQIKYLGDFRVVFDAFFEEVFNFGAVDVPPDAFQSWETRYIPAIIRAFQTRPHKVQQLFNVTGAAIDPQDPMGSAASTSMGVLFYNVFGTSDLIATAGGNPYDNQATVYQGSKSDVALNARLERATGSSVAQLYINDFYQTTGELERPLVILNNTLDPVVPFAHVGIYNTLVTANGSSAFLINLPVPRYGHCNFTTQELLGAFTLLVARVSGELIP